MNDKNEIRDTEIINSQPQTSTNSDNARGEKPKTVAVEWRFLDGEYAICQPMGKVGALTPPYFEAYTETGEHSLLCRADDVIAEAKVERGYCGVRAVGQLAFPLVGILARAASAMAAAGIPILALSTYDTDYLFWKAAQKEEGKRALTLAGDVVTD